MELTLAQRQSFKRSKSTMRKVSETTVASEGPAQQAAFDKNWIGLATTHGIDLYSELEDPEFVKINQDRGMVVWPFAGSYGSALLGLFDGHGQGGERVAEQCCQWMTELLTKDAELSTNPLGSLADNMCRLDKLVLQARVDDECDPYMCGTTATVVYLRDANVYVAGVGDSRCVLGYVDLKGSVECNELTRDHKPSMEGEKGRLEAAGATVEGVGDRSRMWALHEESDSLCGLNMSRSIGDGFCKQHGVIPDPDVQSFSLNWVRPDSNVRDTFLVVASDGIWECVTSEEACEIVRESSGAQAACQVLLERAQRGWERKTAAYRDDITVIVVFLPFLRPEWDEQLVKEMEEEAAAALARGHPNGNTEDARRENTWGGEDVGGESTPLSRARARAAKGRMEVNFGETGMAKLSDVDVPEDMRNYAKHAHSLDITRHSELAASFKRTSQASRPRKPAAESGVTLVMPRSSQNL